MNKADPSGECAAPGVAQVCAFLIGGALSGGIEVGKEMLVDHKSFQDVDWTGKVKDQALVGGTSALVGSVIGPAAGLVKAGPILREMISGGASVATSPAMAGDDPIDIAANAAIGAVTGGAGKYTSGKLASKLSAMSKNRWRTYSNG